jgi:hypothetical protein
VQLQRYLFADQAPEQDRQVGQRFAEVEHLRPQCLAARERQQLPHQASRPVGVLFDLHDVGKRRVARPVRVEQEIGRHHDGGQDVVEIVGETAGELADGFELLRLQELVLEAALFGNLERIDDGRLLVVLIDRRHVEARPTLALAGQRGVERRALAVSTGRAPNMGLQCQTIAISHDVENGCSLRMGLAAEPRRLEQPGEQAICARDRARPVDRCDRHRRVLKEPHEADAGGRPLLRLMRAPREHERAGGAKPARRSRHALISAHLQGLAGAGLEIDIDRLSAARARHRPQLCGGVISYQVGKSEVAGFDARDIVTKPARQRCVETNNVAGCVHRKEPDRRMIETIDRVLKFAQGVIGVPGCLRRVAGGPQRGASAPRVPSAGGRNLIHGGPGRRCKTNIFL